MTDVSDRFLKPSSPAQRCYEALRARYVEGCSLAEAAERFGYSTDTLRELCLLFENSPAQFLRALEFPTPTLPE